MFKGVETLETGINNLRNETSVPFEHQGEDNRKPISTLYFSA